MHMLSCFVFYYNLFFKKTPVLKTVSKLTLDIFITN